MRNTSNHFHLSGNIFYMAIFIFTWITSCICISISSNHNPWSSVFQWLNFCNFLPQRNTKFLQLSINRARIACEHFIKTHCIYRPLQIKIIAIIISFSSSSPNLNTHHNRGQYRQAFHMLVV